MLKAQCSVMLQAAGYGSHALVEQEFFGYHTPQFPHFANTSILVAFVKPPAGDGGLTTGASAA